jgi:hypothetical protein
LLWPLLPFAALATAFVDRRLAIFCVTVCVVALAIHSVAAQKATRYIYYLLPLMCVLWGCGALKGAQLLGGLVARVHVRMAGAGVGIALALFALVVLNSTEGRRAARVLAGRETLSVLSYAGEADWSSAVPVLAAEAARSTTTVASNGMKALYYLGDYDYELNASIVGETDTRADFGEDPRTGRYAIASAAALARVVEAPGRALVIVENEKLRDPRGAAPETIDLLAARCAPLTLDARSGVHAWTCAGAKATR